MSPVALFVLILVVAFVAMLLVIKPSKSEKALESRLKSIETISTGQGQVTPDLLKQEALSDVPWLNDLMYNVGFFGSLQRLLQQADVQRTVGEVFSASVVLAGGSYWLATYWVPNIIVCLVIGLAAGSIPYLYILFKRGSRFRRFEELLPDAIDLLARALRAGHTITSGIEMVSQEVPEPVATEFGKIFKEQTFGLPFRDAMLNLTRNIPLADVSFLVTAILVQKETGGNLAEILDKTTVVIRERFRLRGQLRIYTAQGRLTGWILGLLPFFMVIMLTLINPSYEKVLLTDPIGQKLVYAGLAMMAAGALLIRKVIQIKV